MTKNQFTEKKLLHPIKLLIDEIFPRIYGRMSTEFLKDGVNIARSLGKSPSLHSYGRHRSRKTVSFRFPLKDHASKLADWRSPVGAPLANF
jgi:hypothetical protein